MIHASRQRIVDAICAAPSENSIALVGSENLLKALWPDQSERPSVRWLRKMVYTRSMPFRRISNRLWFDPAECRRALDRQFKIEEVRI
jgi:hypothetical protein